MIPRRWAHTYPGEWTDIRKWLADTSADPLAHWEKTVADYVGVPHAVAVGSGRRGMQLILEHLRIGTNDEVIIPAYTLGKLVPLIERSGAKAIPADIDPATLNVTPQSVAARLTARTKAVIVLHMFGAPADVPAIAKVLAARGIPVIEDCAHSLGATLDGRQTGSFGYAGFFSFDITKNVNTYGGGMVVTRDPALAEFVRNKNAGDVQDAGPLLKKLRMVRIERFMFATRLAFPMLFALATPTFRTALNRLYRNIQPPPPQDAAYMPAQAKLALKKFETHDARVRERNDRAEQYKALLNPAIRLQRVPNNARSTWYFLVATLPCPAAPIRKRLLLRGIDAGIEEEIADDCAAVRGFNDCPEVRRIFPRAIALPMFDGISPQAVERTARALNTLLS